MPEILDDLHIDVRLKLREVLELERGTIPASLAEYVTEGVQEMAKGNYGKKVKAAVKTWQASHESPSDRGNTLEQAFEDFTLEPPQ